MKVTIIRGDEWHRNVDESYAERIMHCNKWQLESALENEKPLRGWKIQNEDENIA